VIRMQHPRDLKRLRRLALDAQGLLRAEPFGAGVTGARKAITHLGYVQIDTISVVERAHHHVLRTRVPNFSPGMLDTLLRERAIFEYWAHAAAFLPMADFRFSLPYKQAIKNGQTHWHRDRDSKLMTQLLRRIRAEGPLRSRDLEAPPTTARSGWWDWKPAKKALEQLYMEGELMVSAREGFQKSYDLTERVLPAQVSTQMPSASEFAEHLLEQQLRCHGLVSLKGLTYLRRDAELRKAVKVLVNERLHERALQQVSLPNGECFLLDAQALERRVPRASSRLRILSPFDNTVIQRERLKGLFNFDYQIECYVPAAKRQYGYFCLPLLYRDGFVGRMDCKAQRKDRHLEIRSLHLDRGVADSNAADRDDFMQAFAVAVDQFREFQQCDSVSLRKVHPHSLGRSLRAVVAKMAAWGGCQS
jgi:uncharacterized protein YcaQ